MDTIAGLYNYWVIVILMMTGLYVLIARQNLIKKLIGLGLFQTSIFYLYITLGKMEGGTAPILTTPEAAGIAGRTGTVLYSNPLPHVLILTAIVVGIATTAVALALAIRIQEEFGTIEDDEIRAIETGEPES